MQQNFQTAALPGSRFIGGAMGLVFFGVGLSFLGFLWLSPFGAWNSPPLFFRIVGSFISIAFVVMGGALAWGAFRGGGPLRGSIPESGPTQPASPNKVGAYHCAQCAAPLSEKAEVSPLGDVKCTFCGAWFNIYQRKS
jgi:hypothetical protein